MLAWIQTTLRWLLHFFTILPSEIETNLGSAYKGSRPDPPSAVAVVWTENGLRDSAVKQLADIIRWCDHSKLESILIYDPSGTLKLKVANFQSELPGKHIQVGWQASPIRLSITCQACRGANEGIPPTTTTTSSPCSTSADASAAVQRGAPCTFEKLASRKALPDRSSNPPQRDSAPCCADCSPVSAPVGITARGCDSASLCCARLSHDGAIEPVTVTPEAAPAAASAAEAIEAPEAAVAAEAATGAAGAAGATAAAGAAPSTKVAQCAGREQVDCCECCPLASSRPCASYEGVEVQVAVKSLSRTLDDGCVGCRSELASGVLTNGHFSTFPSLEAEGGAAHAAPAATSTELGCSRMIEEGSLGAVRAVPTDPRDQQRGCGSPPPPPLPTRASGQGQALGEDGEAPCGARPERSGAEHRCARVHLLSAEDGYEPVLGAARTGGVCSRCGAAIPLKDGSYREGLSRLRSQMAELAGPAVLVQPELVLVVGPVLTLAGFPPLQVAASEILHLGPSRGLSRARVEAALAKFLRTEQRFGS